MCWYFGRDIYESRNYPIGLMASNWGGTPDEAWSGPDALAKCPHSAGGVANSTDAVTGPGAFSVLWNAMIVPLLPTTIKGAIWYQGEADAGGAHSVEYACTFPAMIDGAHVPRGLSCLCCGLTFHGCALRRLARQVACHIARHGR